MTRSARTLARRSLALCALACCLSDWLAVSQQRAAAPPRTPARSVLFAVTRYDADNTQIEPVAILSRGGYVTPPADGDAIDGADKITADRFISAYFRRGRKLQLFFGGAPAGEVRVVKYLEPGCVSMTAQARAETEAPLGGEVHALAFDASAVPQTAMRTGSSRRAPTPAERRAAIETANDELRRRGAASGRLRDLKVRNLTAIDLDGDARAELIGSFYLGEYETPDYLALLAVIEPTRGAGVFRLAHAVADGRPNVSEISGRVLIDALDLDADGVAEIVTANHYYESHSYTIYKRAARGGWRPVYTGGGGGC